MYNFMINENAHIRDNPKIQYHLEMIKGEEEEFIADRKEMFEEM